VIIAVLIGVVAGVLSGLLGVGGGILFVPALSVVIGLSQVRAEATSLLAVVPVALFGAWRQHRYGNLRVREAVLIGALSAVGVLAGVVLSNVLPERGLRIAFAGLTLFIAARLARESWTTRQERLRAERAG